MGTKSVPDDALLLGDSQAEIRLDLLLDDMLGNRGAAARPDGIDGPAPIAELRDTARRLRAASQWLPLPEGRLAVRQALLVASQEPPGLPGTGRAAWRRAGMWLSGAAMILIVGAWSLGARTLDLQGPASSPGHALRVILEKAGVAWLPGPAQYALTYEFPAVRSPDATGTTRIHGTVGGLPVTLSLTPGADACSSKMGCGTFTIALSQLSAAAGTRFGTMRGTFGCGTDGACTLAFAEMTGVFATVAEPTLAVNTTSQHAGSLTTKVASLNDWVSTVTSAGQRLQAENLLPAGLTVKELTTAAGTNGTGNHNKGDRSGGSSRNDVQTGSRDKRGGGTGASGTAHPAAGAGVGSAPQGGTVQPGSGTRSTTSAGDGSIGRQGSHSASADQDQSPNGKITGGRARGKDGGASSSVGGTGPGTGGSGPSGRGAVNGDHRDGARGHGPESSGGKGIQHDKHGPNGHTEGGTHSDERGPTGGGHGGRGGGTGGDVDQGGTGGGKRGGNGGGDVDQGGTGGGKRGGNGGGTGGDADKGGTGGGKRGGNGGGSGGDVDKGGTGGGTGSGDVDKGGTGGGTGSGDVDKGGTGGGKGGGTGGGKGGGGTGGDDSDKGGTGGGKGGGTGGGKGGGGKDR